jgi:hypothetical protein
VISLPLGLITLELIDRMLSLPARMTVVLLFRREATVLEARVRSRILHSKESHQTKRSEVSFEGA